MIRRAGILVMLAILLFIPNVASAQAITIDVMQISIWPEYDRSDVLVIYHFTLIDSTSLPAKMTLRIPASSGGPYILACEDVNDEGETELSDLEYESRQQGDWLEISFTTPASTVQLEYYDPNMMRDADNRNFTFTWPADHTVQSMAVQVRQPVNVSTMNFEPALDSGETYHDGQVYYSALFGKVDAGEEFDLQISYSKPDDTLSSGYDQIYTVDDGETIQQSSFRDSLPWILGGLGISLITVAVVWYLIPNQRFSARRKAKSAEAGEKQPAPIKSFCHQCGSRINPEDEFCPSCGTKLRK